MKKSFFILSCCVFLISASGCKKRHKLGVEVNNQYKDKDVYTAVNMRYSAAKKKGFYISYKNLELLPVNTKVRVINVRPKGFSMEIPKGKIITITYNELWGGAPIEEIIPLLFSETDMSTKLSQFNKIEKRGIKIGKVLEGMGKKAVIVALGYPSAHKTPSTEQDIWLYWLNKLFSYRVEFKDDKVIDIGKYGR